MLTLARFCAADRIEWMGAVVTQEWSDIHLHVILSGIMPVYQSGSMVFRGTRIPCSLQEAEHAVLRAADIVIMWEVDDQISEICRGRHFQVVHVCHRQSPIEPRYVTAEQHLVAVADCCRGAFGDQKTQCVAVIHNGIDVHRCGIKRDRWAMRANWGCTEESLVIGYLGRIDGGKNGEALARCVSANSSPGVSGCSRLSAAVWGEYGRKLLAGQMFPLVRALPLKVCKSIAKASKVRILHLPPRADRAPDAM